MTAAEIHIFDMDHTLINADCDISWKSYAVKYGLAPESALAEADRFFDDYNAGTLDIHDFLRFQLREFIGRTPEEMQPHMKRHFEEFILGECRPAGVALVKKLLAQKIPVAILTSTNVCLARPVADHFGIDEVMAPQLELDGTGRYTGRITNSYTAGPGKIAPARDFCTRHGGSLASLTYYGDSINDRNLLEVTGHPVAVNPSPALRAIAEENDWTILAW